MLRIQIPDALVIAVVSVFFKELLQRLIERRKKRRGRLARS